MNRSSRYAGSVTCGVIRTKEKVRLGTLGGITCICGVGVESRYDIGKSNVHVVYVHFIASQLAVRTDVIAIAVAAVSLHNCSRPATSFSRSSALPSSVS